MPGFEYLGDDELESLRSIFVENGAVLFSIGADRLRAKSRYFTRDLEESVKRIFSVDHAQAVSSGSAALYIALKTLGVRAGDEVITSVFNYVGDTQAILLCGATPRLVDIDLSLQMSPEAVVAAITARTKVIVVPHMMGQAAPIKQILKIANDLNISVIEDACQALGGSLDGRLLGTYADIGFFSLDFGKVVTCGEGGLLLTRNPSYQKIFNEAHNHGRWSSRERQSVELSREVVGFNFRMTELQAAVAIVQMNKLARILSDTRNNSILIQNLLQDQLPANIQMRPCVEGCQEVGDSIVFFAPNKLLAERLRVELNRSQIGLKLLPNDLNWHFGGNWANLWDQVDPQYPLEMNNWRHSGEILERGLALTVWGRWNKEDCTRVAKTTLSIIKKVVG